MVGLAVASVNQIENSQCSSVNFCRDEDLGDICCHRFSSSGVCRLAIGYWIRDQVLVLLSRYGSHICRYYCFCAHRPSVLRSSCLVGENGRLLAPESPSRHFRTGQHSRRLVVSDSHSDLVRRRAETLVRLHQQHQFPYTVLFGGLELQVIPDVFCPAYGEGSHLLGMCLQGMQTGRVLDVGTGSGALAILAAARGM